MNKLQQKASLHEKAVQKVAAENIKHRKPRGKDTRKRNSKVVVTTWSDDVDPRIVKELKRMHIPRLFERVEVVTPTEVIIHNPGWKKTK